MSRTPPLCPDTHRLDELLRELATYYATIPDARAHFAAARAHGLHITPNHFYSPIPDAPSLSPDVWSTCSELPGIDMNEAGQLQLMDECFAGFTETFRGFAHGPVADELTFTYDNDQISGPDPMVLYALLRTLRPARVVEVGAGFSTLMTRRALLENGTGQLDCVEPYPRAFLARAVEGLGTLHRTPVQQVPMELFTSLGEGDILFIDSSHVSKLGSDVNHLFLEVLPRLAPGVWVHVHDIFLPCDYPRMWTEEMQFFWNEQYLLQAFLIGNADFCVRYAVGWMGRRHPERMAEVFPGWALGLGGGSFWMQRV